MYDDKRPKVLWGRELPGPAEMSHKSYDAQLNKYLHVRQRREETKGVLTNDPPVPTPTEAPPPSIVPPGSYAACILTHRRIRGVAGEAVA